ncbi:4-hydroxybutyrate coenzyme A transferase [Cryptotermes secundus]|uniref:4-hydroxybutyrate coenzyme A transferase n=1 Tax=Cryptotermes secundus TaxID=105785 RepID=UPI000CD7B1BE|nr:4-hydroxybutyrate coenzyme A transferase [Cryptotermes secundus]
MNAFKKVLQLNPLRCFSQYSKAPAGTNFVSANEALKRTLNSGNTVFIQGAAATPVPLVKAMTAVAKEARLKDIKVCHIHTEGPAPYSHKDYEGIFRTYSFFIGANVRKGIAEGHADSVPIFLSQIPSLFHKKIFQPSISLIQVSAPDRHGFCSLGTSVDCVPAALMHSKTIIAQVNEKMPRTFGDTVIHQSQIDYAVELDCPIVQHERKAPSEAEKEIGKLIAENLVEDGATLQMGIGSIPDAVLSALKGHKHLGIHSEMFSDGVVDLVKCGAITNSEKSMHKGKIIGSFLMGSQKLYDFVHDNPSIEMLAVDHVNDTDIISKQTKMTAINSCISVDLSGQVNADSIGTRMYSGFGGQLDFIYGAAIAADKKGKPIIALESTTKTGESKIVPYLKEGAGVVTTRGHVRYVVTEHGIADLFGKSLQQRSYALINIAHPKHREALTKAAFERFKVMPSP